MLWGLGRRSGFGHIGAVGIARRRSYQTPTSVFSHYVRKEDGLARDWLDTTISRIEADFARSADTHLVSLPLAGDVDLFFKDETTHPSGSLKHRLARSLFLYALCNGWVREGTTVIEASSGSTAISEAYFARMLGLPFIAVVPRSTSAEKRAQIEFYGGRLHLVDSADAVSAASHALARETGGHFMDQFTFAERATDWRGNNNIAESVFAQMMHERFPIPAWIVVGAGTGGTSATFGRYVRYRRRATRIAVVDPQNSVFSAYHRTGDRSLTSSQGSRIEGIGRPRVEPSFVRDLVDEMIEVADIDSIAAMRVLSAQLGRRVGPSTGTNFMGVLKLRRQMRERDAPGSIVSLICDSGERYPELFDDACVTTRFGAGLAERIAAVEQAIG
jgi:cysteine synthase